MQAMPYVCTWGSAADIETAQRLFARALAINPDYPRANTLLAWTYAAQAQIGWADAEATLPLALARAQTGIAGDADDPWGHLAAGYVHIDGLHHVAIAARLGPRDYTQAANLSTAGLCHFMTGRFAETIDCKHRADQLRRTSAARGAPSPRPQASPASGKSRRRPWSRRAASTPASIGWLEKYHPIVRDDDRALFIQGLRAAGLD